MTHKEKVSKIIEHVEDKLPVFFNEGSYPLVKIGKVEMEVLGIEKHGTMHRALMEGRMSIPLVASEAVCDAINSQLKLW